jgi:hypothetical protein
VVLHLGFGGQREEALERIVGAIDVGLGDAVAADTAETPLAVGRAQFGHEGRTVAAVGRRGEASDVEGRDLAHAFVSLSCRVG